MKTSNYRLYLNGEPALTAYISGGRNNPQIAAVVRVYSVEDGSLVEISAEGLPKGEILGFHIHDGESCEEFCTEPFPRTGSHYQKCPRNVPNCQKHPYHAGDLPSIFTNDGDAYMAFYTNRFLPEDVDGKTAVIHSGSDDFMTDPSGNSGEKIACGKLVTCI